MIPAAFRSRASALRWAFLPFLLSFAASWAQSPAPNESSLEAKVQAIVAQHHGKVALFAENLRSGETLGVNPDQPVQTASTIKLTILFDAMQQVRSGSVRLDDPIVLRKEDQVGGSGILQFFDTPVTLTLRDVLMLMITQSDNTATNLAIDKLGVHNINAETRKLGLKDTWLYKKIMKPATEPMPPDQKIYGLGKTTPREIASVMAHMYRCDFDEPSRPGDLVLCSTMLTMLQHQFFRDGLPRLLERGDTARADAAMGNKTGALDAVRADVGLVSTKAGPVILAIYTYENADHSWSTDNEGQLTIAKLADLIVTTWSPDGFDPAAYKPTPAAGQ